MIVCPSCGKANGDGRRHCNWCGCYLPPLLHEEDVRHSTWSNLAMLKEEQELAESEWRRRMERAEPRIRITDMGLVSLYDGVETQVFVNGRGNVVRVER